MPWAVARWPAHRSRLDSLSWDRAFSKALTLFSKSRFSSAHGRAVPFARVRGGIHKVRYGALLPCHVSSSIVPHACLAVKRIEDSPYGEAVLAKALVLGC